MIYVYIPFGCYRPQDLAENLVELDEAFSKGAKRDIGQVFIRAQEGF